MNWMPDSGPMTQKVGCRNFQSQGSTPRFSTVRFSQPECFNQGVKKFTLEKSSSWFIVEKSGVEKSRVETSCNQKAMALF